MKMIEVDAVISLLKKHEALWLADMDMPAKKGGLRNHATACLYRASAIEEARREIEAMTAKLE